jgi:GxxExxY protein
MTDNELTREIIGAAIEVHRALGPGLLESAYEECLCHELSVHGLHFERQKPVPSSTKMSNWIVAIALICCSKAVSSWN